jgi:hypothetical protein
MAQRFGVTAPSQCFFSDERRCIRLLWTERWVTFSLRLLRGSWLLARTQDGVDLQDELTVSARSTASCSAAPANTRSRAVAASGTVSHASGSACSPWSVPGCSYARAYE